MAEGVDSEGLTENLGSKEMAIDADRQTDKIHRQLFDISTEADTKLQGHWTVDTNSDTSYYYEYNIP